MSDTATAPLWETFRVGGGAELIRKAVELVLQGLIEAEAAEAICTGPLRSRAFVSVPDGFVVCGLMTTRSNRPVPTAVVFGISGGAGTTTVVVPLANLARAGHGGLVDCDSGAFDVLGRPPDKPGWAAGRRNAVGGDCAGS